MAIMGVAEHERRHSIFLYKRKVPTVMPKIGAVNAEVTIVSATKQANGNSNQTVSEFDSAQFENTLMRKGRPKNGNYIQNGHKNGDLTNGKPKIQAGNGTVKNGTATSGKGEDHCNGTKSSNGHQTQQNGSTTSSSASTTSTHCNPESPNTKNHIPNEAPNLPQSLPSKKKVMDMGTHFSDLDSLNMTHR